MDSDNSGQSVGTTDFSLNYCNDVVNFILARPSRKHPLDTGASASGVSGTPGPNPLSTSPPKKKKKQVKSKAQVNSSPISPATPLDPVMGTPPAPPHPRATSCKSKAVAATEAALFLDSYVNSAIGASFILSFFLFDTSVTGAAAPPVTVTDAQASDSVMSCSLSVGQVPDMPGGTSGGDSRVLSFVLSLFCSLFY